MIFYNFTICFIIVFAIIYNKIDDPTFIALVSLLLMLFSYSFLYKKANKKIRIPLSYYLNENLELEKFLTLFVNNLKLNQSPELSLLCVCKEYDDEKVNLTIIQNTILGLPAYKTLMNLCNFFSSNYSKRILTLFSRSLKYNTKYFVEKAHEILTHLKENIKVQKEIEGFMFRIRIRVTLISITSSAILSFFSKILPFFYFILNGKNSFTTNSLEYNALTFFVNLSFFILAFFNTYTISSIMFHSHAFVLSICSALVFILTHLILPEIKVSI